VCIGHRPGQVSLHVEFIPDFPKAHPSRSVPVANVSRPIPGLLRCGMPRVDRQDQPGADPFRKLGDLVRAHHMARLLGAER
jgi:hypothetical protein